MLTHVPLVAVFTVLVFALMLVLGWHQGWYRRRP